MRLIDADTLMEQIRLMANRTSLGEISLPSIGGLEITGLIINAPTIDGVPVVRCKDCWKRGGYQCPMFYEELVSYDEWVSDWIEHDKTTDDGFCHCGERIGELND